MPDTDQQAMNEASKIDAVNVVAKPQVFPFVAQVSGIAALFAMTLFGFAWWHTGSAKLVWPWLRGQQLVFEPTRIDCGNVAKNEIIERQIRVVNVSSKPLSLVGSQQSCSCITLDDFPIVISPGKEYQLKLKVGISPNAGPFEQSIKFFSDEPGYSSVVVTIAGSVP